MIDYYDAFDDFLSAWEVPESKSRGKKNTSKRTVKYVGPGHTRVGYAHRTLDIKFKQTPEQFKAKQRSRRKAGAKKAAKNRVYTPRRKDEYYVEMRHGEMIYVDKKGRDVTNKVRRLMDDGDSEMMKYDLKRDAYDLEDMRALLRDAHWEEVCGHKRWTYDKKSTVKEFSKYQKYWR